MTALAGRSVFKGSKPFVGPRLDPNNPVYWEGIIPGYLRAQMAENPNWLDEPLLRQYYANGREIGAPTALRPWGDIPQNAARRPSSAPTINIPPPNVPPMRNPEQLQLPFEGNALPTPPVQGSFDWSQLPEQKITAQPPLAEANGQLRLFPNEPRQLSLVPEERAAGVPEGPSAQTAFQFPENPWQMPLDFDKPAPEAAPVVPKPKPDAKTLEMLKVGKNSGYTLSAWLEKQPNTSVVSVGNENIDPSTLHRVQDWTNEKKLSDWQEAGANVKDMPPVEVLRTDHGDYLYDGTHRAEYATRQGEQVPAKVFTIKSEAERAPAETPQPQAINPSQQTPTTPKPQVKPRGNIAQANAMEGEFRPVVQTIAKLTQLKQAGEDRFHVENAVRKAGTQLFSDEDFAEFKKRAPEWTPPTELQGGSDNPFLDTNAKYEALDTKEKATVDAVAKTLKVVPESLYNEDGEWRLSGQQYDDLRSKLEVGKKPGKNTDAVQPLAHINPENATAAGLKNARNLRELMSPEDRMRVEREEQNQGAVLPNALAVGTNGVPAEYNLSTPKARAGLASTLDTNGLSVVTADEAGLGMRNEAWHEAQMRGHQAVLQAAIERGTQALRDRVPLWEAKRSGTSKPSKLAQEIDALPDAIKAQLPKELYDPKHTGAQANNAVASTVVQKPVSTTEATPAASSAEVRPVAPNTEGTSSSLLAATNKAEAAIREAFPKQTEGAFPLLKQVLRERLGESSEDLPKAYVGALKLFVSKLKAGDENALQSTVNTLKRLKSGETTFHANPITEMYRRAVRAATPASGAASMDEFLRPDPNHPIDAFAKDLAQQPTVKEPLQVKFNRWLQGEMQRVPAFMEAAKSSLATAVQNTYPMLQQAWQKFADTNELSATYQAFGERNFDQLRLAAKHEPFIRTFEELHPDPIRRAAIVAHAESYIAHAEGPVPEGTPEGRGVIYRYSDEEARANLQAQADQIQSLMASSRAFKKAHPIFQAALNLTDSEKAFAERYRKYNDDLVDWEHNKGLTYQALSDYWMHAFKPGATLRDAIKGLRGSSGYQTTASFMKMRHAMTYYEGLTRGLQPTSMDGAYLIAQRGLTSARVIANRDMVARLRETNSADGQPVLAFNRAFTHVDPAEGGKGAVYLKTGLPPAAQAADGRPYVPYEHPAFTDWRWWGTDTGGKPILGMSDVWVHPDEIGYIRKEMDPSLFRQYAPLNAAVNVRNTAKSTLLSLSGFHAVQLTTHAAEHAMVGAVSKTLTVDTLKTLNPFHAERVVDLNDLDQQQGIIHGLELRSPLDPGASVSEGLSGKGGLTEHSPVLGAVDRLIHNLTFNKVQPDLKMRTYLDALNRNRNIYLDKWTARELKNVQAKAPNLPLAEQTKIASQLAQGYIYRRSVAQANFAFGGINFARLGLGKTGQDALGFLLLAPDFLTARAGFVADAFRPGGSESRWALGLGMATTFAVIQGLNLAINGKSDFHANNPDTWGEWNRLHVGKYSVSMRSAQGDAIELALGTRNQIKYGDRNLAVEHRLNPLLRPSIELASNTDAFGNRATRDQQLLDAFNSGQPIPVQGAIQAIAAKLDKGLRQPQDNHEVISSLLSSFGLQTKKYRTPAETVAFREFDKLPKAEPQTDLELEQRNTFKYLRQQVQAGGISRDDVVNAVRGNGKHVVGIGQLRLKRSEVPYLTKTYNDSQLVQESRHLTPEPFFRVWKVADEQEQQQLAPLFAKKIQAMPESPEKNEMRKTLNDYKDNLNPQQLRGLATKLERENQ